MRRALQAAALACLGIAAGCAGDPARDGTGEDPASREEAAGDEAEDLLARTNERPVLLFFPSQDGERLVPEERIIFLTATLTSQVKQAVSEVLLGPGDDDADAVPAFPARTRLLSTFLLPDGTAVVDLGSEAGAIPHGSAAELAAVYAIVNTIAYNFPGVERVRLLVEGQEVPTLAGHVDLTRALTADLKRVDWGSFGPPPDPAGPAPESDRWVDEDPADAVEAPPEEAPPDEVIGPI